MASIVGGIKITNIIQQNMGLLEQAVVFATITIVSLFIPAAFPDDNEELWRGERSVPDG
jgi:hypothetical protein